ncbi:hypothetical protein [Streptomyces sp. NRRL S-813]|uniref:hypothetical protein n=1 Tax=Streptomyces sp. NRRL S-813 TaxID=1463919 RepID=UPI0004BE55C8|nr:hypothetical protein [Streptomyces sp. NRRL S-813]
MNEQPGERPGRYHVTLSAAGRPVLHGWWDSEPTARPKFTSIVGEHGRDGVTITLVDEETGETLTTWPDKA